MSTDDDSDVHQQVATMQSVCLDPAMKACHHCLSSGCLYLAA